MAYSQHEWVNGEVITAEKLNNMEQGISDAEAKEITASAEATVENTGGEPSCEVVATGSAAAVDFKFAFKGIKGEAAPTITACELTSEGGTITGGELKLSDGSAVPITVTVADSGDDETPATGETEGGEETPAEGDGAEEGDNQGDSETEAETESGGETSETPATEEGGGETENGEA